MIVITGDWIYILLGCMRDQRGRWDVGTSTAGTVDVAGGGFGGGRKGCSSFVVHFVFGNDIGYEASVLALMFGTVCKLLS